MSDLSPSDHTIVDRARAAGQGHVFDDLADLSPSDRRSLLDGVGGVDFEELAQLRALIGSTASDAQSFEPLTPLVPDDAQRDAWAALGWDALRAGRVALLVVAGGQGTRLGWEAPKGTYPVGPVTDKSLYALFAEQVAALSQRSGHSIPLYVLTSRLNRAQTESYFAEHADFGLQPGQIRFLEQRDLPNVDFSGRLVRSAPGQLAQSPNGHGGSLLALREGGALESMRAAGQDLLFYWQVDNPLCAVADPVFLGAHLEARAQASTKVVEKLDPGERVGILALSQDRPRVVEYSEMSAEEQSRRTPTGELAYRAGNIAVHLFARDFLEASAQSLDYHLARKAVSVLGDESPQAPNVIKFETFIFDLLPHAEVHVTLQVPRDEEFEPLKNAEGSYSPLTVREALSQRARRWLEAAGHAPPPGIPCEVSPLTALGPQDLAQVSLPAPGSRGLNI
jgi:UDP-N-acetylglucosamine/UDP-N-acetylgalactosamine diphosphorylase